MSNGLVGSDSDILDSKALLFNSFLIVQVV
jgi:hypothetical protein